MKTVTTRSDGTEEVLSDYAYDFNDQRGYASDKLIYFGDLLTTTCTFETTAPEPCNTARPTTTRCASSS